MSRRNSKIPRWLAYAGWGSLVVGVSGLFYLALLINDLPKPEQFEQRKVNQSTKIYDRTGKVLLYEIHGEEKRTIIPFEEIPDYVKQATIAIEDGNFYNHPAFDWRSILRALFKDFISGQYSQGGSTITQQLAKKAFLSDEKTATRKIKELFVAIELEKRYTKDQILNLYLNQIPYGGNAYGIEAASQTFFRKKSGDLTLAEAATLVSLPNAPSYYSPWGNHLDELLARKDSVLQQMFTAGYIDKEELERAQRAKLEFAPKATGIKAPHFVLAVQEYLNSKYGEDFVESSGLNVITTLDWNLQQIAEKAVLEGAARNTDLYKGHNAALVAQDATNGQIVALVGSKDYFAPVEPKDCAPGKNCHFEGNFNVAIQGLRQPGSAMKPFAYYTAFYKGYSPDSMVFDLPTEFAANNPSCPLQVDFTNENDECFHPHNFDGYFRGPVNLRNALAQSINIPAVKTLYLAGIDDTLETAKDFGITTLTERSRYGLSLVLGGGEIKLLELVGAYSVFAQDGVRRQQTFIISITNSRGETLESYRDNSQEVADKQSVRLVNDVLMDIKARSSLFVNSLPLTLFPNQEVALKTGTTNDYHDAWTIGYTPQFVVGVWAGNNDNIAMQQQGSSLLAALPMWSNFMKEALKDKPLSTFSKPDPITPDKAMLRGDYVVKYKIGNIVYPHIHDILFYVNKETPLEERPQNPEKDSQFKNWEEPVIRWAEQNIPNFYQSYNQILPADALEEIFTTNQEAVIEIKSPKNGDFISSNTLVVNAIIGSADIYKKIQLLLNNQIIDERQGIFPKNFSYQFSNFVSQWNTQNYLTLRLIKEGGESVEKRIILFR
ncbi:MAG TPA: transglycosylase domain-containing protein [Candidatus Paceibacterota bacterium]